MASKSNVWWWLPWLVLGSPTAFADDGHGHGHGHTHGHGAHEHGVGQLQVVVDGALVLIELESPAHDLVGFEHRPRNEAQREALGEAVTALENGGRLFSFGPGGLRCRLHSVTVLSDLLEDDEVHGPTDHADVFAAWEFECDRAGIREIDAAGFFSRFPGTTRLRVQAVGERGQTTSDLSAGASRLQP